jgi:hypothetical protein
MDHNFGQATTPGVCFRVASLARLVDIRVTFHPRSRTVRRAGFLPRADAELTRYRLDATLHIRSSYLCRRAKRGGGEGLGGDFLSRFMSAAPKCGSMPVPAIAGRQGLRHLRPSGRTAKVPCTVVA